MAAIPFAPAPQVATAATAAAAGLEGFRMLFSSFEQPDGSFGCGGMGALLARAAPPLMILLPAVAASAAAGGGLGGAELPAPLAWGVLAAALGTSGGGTVLDQLLWRPTVRMGP